VVVVAAVHVPVVKVVLVIVVLHSDVAAMLAVFVIVPLGRGMIAEVALVIVAVVGVVPVPVVKEVDVAGMLCCGVPAVRSVDVRMWTVGRVPGGCRHCMLLPRSPQLFACPISLQSEGHVLPTSHTRATLTPHKGHSGLLLSGWR
jgi:hypothetical protein